jgi:hypothetical protein
MKQELTSTLGGIMDKNKNPQQKNPFQAPQRTPEKTPQNPLQKNPAQKKPASNW